MTTCAVPQPTLDLRCRGDQRCSRGNTSCLNRHQVTNPKSPVQQRFWCKLETGDAV